MQIKISNFKFQISNFQKGQTLIEVLVALSVSGIVLTAISNAILSGLTNSLSSKSQNQATAYAQQGMEQIRQLRDSDWDAFSTNILPEPTPNVLKTFCMNKTDDLRSSLSTAANTSLCLASSDGLKRSIVTEYGVAPCVNATKVTVTVFWTDNKCQAGNAFCHNVKLSSCLSDSTKSTTSARAVTPGVNVTSTPVPTPTAGPSPTAGPVSPTPTPVVRSTPTPYVFPTPTSVPTGTILTYDTEFVANFDSSDNGFTPVDGPYGAGLWHLTSRKSVSSARSFWYGQESSGNYATTGGIFNVATRNSGYLVSSKIDLTGKVDQELSFNSWYQTESDSTKDTKRVEITTNGGLIWSTIYTISTSSGSWQKIKVDLSSYSGQTIQIRFWFDTIDPYNNSFEGWYLDNVRIGDKLSPIAYYKFDEGSGTTAADATGLGNNGTLIGSPTWMTAGKVNGALQLNGTNAGVQVWNASLNVSKITVAAWVNVSANQVSRIFVDNYTQPGGVTRGWGLGISDTVNNKIKWFTSTDTGVKNSLESNAILANNTWYYVVGTFDGSIKKLYINGVLDTSITWNQAIGYTSTVSSIGYLRDPGGQYFNGIIDEVKIYDRVLSGAEIATEYSSQVAYLRLDDGAGTSASDSTGNNNTGTLVNSPSWTAGAVNGALQFNGSNSYINVADNTVLDIPKAITVEAWVKPLALGQSNVGIVTKRFSELTDPFNSYVIGIGSGGTYTFCISNATASSQSCVSSISTVAAVWTHVAGTYDGANLKIFVNGSLELSLAKTGTIGYSSSSLRIGCLLLGSQCFNGIIDEVKIYKRAFTDNEIFNEFLSTVHDSPIGSWKFDEGTGFSVDDSSGYGNALTLNGYTWTPGCINNSNCVITNSDTVSGNTPSTQLFNTKYSFTYNLWFKAGSLYTDQTFYRWPVLMANKGGDTHKGYGLRYELLPNKINNSSKLYFEWGQSPCDGSRYTSTTLANNILDNTWHMATVTYDGNSLKGYFDGTNVASATQTSVAVCDIGTNTMVFRPRYSQSPDITIDEAKIYNRALSSAEVSTLYISAPPPAVVPAPTPIPTQTAPVGWWKLDDGSGSTTTDSSGRSYTGTLYNSPAWSSGIKAGSLTFNGMNSFVRTNPAGKVSAPFTVSAWVKPSISFASVSSTGNWQGAISTRIPNDFGFDMQVYTDKLHADIGTGSTWVATSADASVSLPSTSWSHVTYVVSLTGYTIYVNGSQVGSGTLYGTSLLWDLSHGVYFGVVGDGGYYSGGLDDIKIYNRALASTEVFDEFNSLVGYWKFDETTGATAADSSNNANNATLVNGPTWVSGNTNNAIKVGSSNQYVSLSSNIDLNGYDYTISAWINFPLPSTTGGWRTLTRGPNFDHQVIFDSSGNIGVYDNKTGTGFHSAGLMNPPIGWHHIVAVATGGTTTFYLDGIYFGSTNFKSNGDLRYIGNYQGGGQNIGKVDELKIFLRPLSALEVASYYSATAAQGPIAWWKFNEGTGAAASDSSGNSYAGTLINNPPWVPGKSSWGLNLNGSNSYVEVASVPSLKYTGGFMTLSAWIYPTTTGHIISKPWNGSGQYNYRLVYGNNIAFCLYGSSTEYCLTSATTVSTNSWHLVTVSVDYFGNMKIYIDGALNISGINPITSWNPSSGDSNTPLSIGTLYPYGPGWDGLYGGNPSGFTFGGKIDEVKMWNRALTSAQVTNEYNTAPDVDTIAPVRTSVSLTPGGGNTGYSTFRTISLDLAAEDNVGVIRYYVSETSSTTPSLTAITCAAGNLGSTNNNCWRDQTAYPVDIPYIFTSDGAKTIRAWYRDGAGNISVLNTQSITIDTGVPAIAVTAPVNNSYKNASNYTSFTVSGTCSDATSGTVSNPVQVRFNGTNVSVVSGVAPTCSANTSGTWAGTYSLAGYSDGNISITAVISDKAGNSFTSASITTIKDTVSPTITINPNYTNPVMYPNTNISLSGTCTEKSKWNINVSITSGSYNTTFTNQYCSLSGTWNNNFSISGGPYGTYTITVSHYDVAGNTLYVYATTQRPPPPTINNFAGKSNPSLLGDGGAATNASIRSPGDVAVDSSGNIYIADTYNQRIRKVNTSGIITTIAGTGVYGFSGDGGAAVNAYFYNPRGVAVDSSGNIYIADTNNQRIRKVNTSGIITTIAGNGIPGSAGDGGAATNANLYYPSDVAVDSSGNIYIADTSNQRIRKVNTSGIITTIAGTGVYGFSGDGGAATSAQLRSLYGVAVDSSGNVYIADTYNYRIRKVNTSGIITTIAGNGISGFSGDGGAAVNAYLYNPLGVAVDSSGNVYIADTNNSRIRKVNTSGIITTIAGNGISGSAGDGGNAYDANLNAPWDITLDSSGNLYVSDSGNSRIRKITGL